MTILSFYVFVNIFLNNLNLSQNYIFTIFYFYNFPSYTYFWVRIIGLDTIEPTSIQF